MSAALPFPPIRALLLCAAALLGACSSAPVVRYYTLQAPAPASALAVEPGTVIQVLPVQIPAQVDVPEIVIRQGAGELARVETQQWIAPLHTELRAALSQHLQRKLGARDVQGLPQAEAKSVRRVRVVFTRVEAYLGHRAELEATWTVGTLDTPAQLTCASRAQENAGGGYEALVTAYQRALARIGDDIAAAMSATPPACVR